MVCRMPARSSDVPDLIDEIRALASKIERSRDSVQTEEATKHALVMPFIAALGYDVFDPTEVTPEYVADVGVKKGEKIDYAVLKDGKPIMFFECKQLSANLDNEHASQLYRYFACSSCRVAVLTNGLEYRFFSDLDAPNKMDQRPFLVFRVSDFPEPLLPELKKLSKDTFDLDAVLSTANELKYMREIKLLLAEQLREPSDEFARYCAAGIGVPKFTQAVKEQFRILTRRALTEFVADTMGEKLRAALGGTSTGGQASPEVAASSSTPTKKEASVGIETTVEELEAFCIVKSILRQHVDVRRIASRDHHGFFNVLLDDSIRKPIVRFYFDGKKAKYLGLIGPGKEEDKVAIEQLDDLYQHTDRIVAAALMHSGLGGKLEKN